MLKIFKSILAVGLISLTVTACSSESSNVPDTATESKAEEKKVLSKEEFEQLYSDPTKFKGDYVDFYAQVFMPPEKDDKGTYVQAWADPKQSAKNTIIAINDPSFEVKQNDILHVKGTVFDKFEGENMMGGKVVAPSIIAESVEITDYAIAFSPAIKTIDINVEANQHGFSVVLNKVELAADETRVYLKVTNNMKSKGSLFEHTAKLVQGGTQVDPTMDFSQRYPKLNNELLPAVTSEGVIVFPPLKADGGAAKLFIEGFSDDFNVQFEPFVFDINL